MMFDLTLFPAVDAIELGASWAIYDPTGITTAELAKLGVRAETIEFGDDLSAVDVLVVGARALESDSRFPFRPTEVARGLRVVVFEQPAATLQTLGFRVEDVVPRYAFPRVPEHPILAGMGPEDLVNWRGEGQLIPAQSDPINFTFPYPDRRVHWGNYGSVASVVIETPHRGAFTSVVETEFDLAYSTVLQWRHGSGEVLFIQLDLTGRIGVEPAADQILVNVIAYLDNPPDQSPADQDRRVLYLGTDDDEARLLGGLGFDLTGLDPTDTAAGLGNLTGTVVVIGRGTPAILSTRQRRRIQAHVRSGGHALLLPQTGEHLDQTPWPRRLSSERVSLARIHPDQGGSNAAVLRGIGPQLLHWRMFVDLDLIQPDTLSPGADHLLGGLVTTINDVRGSWVLSQLDWRQIDEGGHNTRRTSWNVRKFYRQLLTNLGARTAADTAELMLPNRHYAPLTNVDTWRASRAVETVPYEAGVRGPLGWPSRSLPALADLFRVDPWPETSGDDWGTVIEADSDGLVDLAAHRTPQAGDTAYARTYIYSHRARIAIFSVDAATWFALKVNSDMVVDQGTDGTWFPFYPGHRHITTTAPLNAGWNTLEILVTANQEGFNYSDIAHGFWVQTSNPGDLITRPDATAPQDNPPTRDDALLADRPHEHFYVEPHQQLDDVYGFMHW